MQRKTFIGMTANFLSETMEDTRQWNSKMLNEQGEST